MSLWDDIYNKASEVSSSVASSVTQAVSGACQKVVELASAAYEKAQEVGHDVANTARMLTNNVKYGALAIASATMNGTGELLRDAKSGIISLKNVAIDKVADGAKLIGKCGKALCKCSLPMKLLSAGEAVYDLCEGSCQKACEFAGSWGLGAAAATGAGALLAATPVGWAAAGIFVAGVGGAMLGDWIGGKVGKWIDGEETVQKTEPASLKTISPAIEIRNAIDLEEIRRPIGIPEGFEVRKPSEIYWQPSINAGQEIQR